MRGRSRRLLLNYRTTRQIGGWATELLRGQDVSDLDEGKDSLRGYHSLISGKEPIDLRSIVLEEKMAKVRAYLAGLTAEQLKSTCLACPTIEGVEEWKRDLEAWNIDALVLG